MIVPVILTMILTMIIIDDHVFIPLKYILLHSQLYKIYVTVMTLYIYNLSEIIVCIYTCRSVAHAYILQIKSLIIP